VGHGDGGGQFGGLLAVGALGDYDEARVGGGELVAHREVAGGVFVERREAAGGGEAWQQVAFDQLRGDGQVQCRGTAGLRVDREGYLTRGQRWNPATRCSVSPGKTAVGRGAVQSG
jgi:hypothetical protein